MDPATIGLIGFIALFANCGGRNYFRRSSLFSATLFGEMCGMALRLMYGPWGNEGLCVTFELPVVSEVEEVCQDVAW